MRAGVGAGMMIVGCRFRIRLADHDGSCTGQLLQVESAHGLDEGVHLGRIRGDLEQQPRVRSISNSSAVLARYSFYFAGISARYFEHGQGGLAYERVAAPDLGYRDDVDETRELLEHLVHVH